MADTIAPAPVGSNNVTVNEELLPQSDDEMHKTGQENWSGMELEPFREDQVRNAIKFLSHPAVKGTSELRRRTFLETKGLSKKEIDEAFRQFLDSPSNDFPSAVTNKAGRSSNEGLVSNTSLVPTHQGAAYQMVPATYLSVARARPMIRWSRMMLALAFLLGACTGTGFLLKRLIFKLKSWIQWVVWEDDCTMMIASQRKMTEEALLAAASAAKAASVAAAEVANASREVIMIHTEEKRHVTSVIQALKAHTVDLTSIMMSLKMVMEGVNNTRQLPANLLAIGNQMEQKPLSYISKSASISAHKDLVSDNGHTARTSEAPSLRRPDSAPHSTSYQKILEMLERGEMPPGIKNIDDKPPNPDQPPSASRLQPRQKPWEMGRKDVGSSLTQIQRPIMNTVNSTFHSSSSAQVDGMQPRHMLTGSDTKSEATEQKNSEVKQNPNVNWPSEELGSPKEVGNAMSRAAESSPTISSLDGQGRQKVWGAPSFPKTVKPGAAAAFQNKVFVQEALFPTASTKQLSAEELNEELPVGNAEMVLEYTSAQLQEGSTGRTMDPCTTGNHEDEKARSSSERLSPVTMCNGFESEKATDLQSFEDFVDHTSCKEPAANEPVNVSTPALKVTDSSQCVSKEPVVAVEDVPPAAGVTDVSMETGELQDIANSSPVAQLQEESTGRTMEPCTTGKHEDTVVVGTAEKARSSPETLSPVTMRNGLESEKVTDLQSFEDLVDHTNFKEPAANEPANMLIPALEVTNSSQSEKVTDLQSCEDLVDHTSCKEPAANEPANMSTPALEVIDSSQCVSKEPVVAAQNVPPATGVNDVSTGTRELQDIANSSPVAQLQEESTRRNMDPCTTGKHEDTVVVGTAEKARSSPEKLSPVMMCNGFERERETDLQSFEDLVDHTSCKEPAANEPANMSIPALEVTDSPQSEKVTDLQSLDHTSCKEPAANEPANMSMSALEVADSSQCVSKEPVVAVHDVPPATGVNDVSMETGELQDIANSSPVTQTLLAQHHLMDTRADEEYMQDSPEFTLSMEAASLQNIQKSTVAAEATESTVSQKPAVTVQDAPSSTDVNGISMQEPSSTNVECGTAGQC